MIARFKPRIAKPHGHPPSGGCDAGFALVASIWFIGFLATAAVLLSTTTRLSIQSTAFTIENAKAQALANGLVELAGLALVSENRDRVANDRIPRNGSAIECSLHDGWAAVVTIQDQRGLLNVNLASKTTLRKYLELVLPDRSKALQLATEIVQFRNAGAQENPAHKKLTQFALGNDGRFRSLDELDLVDGMTPETRLQIVRFLTVHGQSTSIDFDLAPAEFRELAKKMVPGRGASASDITRIDVVVSKIDGATAGRSAVIDPLPHPRRPFTVLAWSDWSQATKKPPGQTSQTGIAGQGCEKTFAQQ